MTPSGPKKAMAMRLDAQGRMVDELGRVSAVFVERNEKEKEKEGPLNEVTGLESEGKTTSKGCT